jgi:hypothetical protein
MSIGKRLVSSLEKFVEDLQQGNLDNYRTTRFELKDGELVRTIKNPRKENHDDCADPEHDDDSATSP